MEAYAGAGWPYQRDMPQPVVVMPLLGRRHRVQLMMAEKARMFGDREMLKKILEAVHPKEMKAYGRAVRNFDKERWDGACYEIVKRGNEAKFSQNPDLWEYLKGTIF